MNLGKFLTAFAIVSSAHVARAETILNCDVDVAKRAAIEWVEASFLGIEQIHIGEPYSFAKKGFVEEVRVPVVATFFDSTKPILSGPVSISRFSVPCTKAHDFQNEVRFLERMK